MTMPPTGTGQVGSGTRTPYWRIALTHPGDGWGPDGQVAATDNPAPCCRPTVEMRLGTPIEEPCAYRGRCLGCGERGPVVGAENGATEWAHDHAFPGWRELPVVPRLPWSDTVSTQRRRTDVWRERIEVLLPAGWLDRGGPIRTERPADSHGRRVGMRHVPHRAPGGGYDMATTDPTVDLTACAKATARRRAAIGDVEIGDNFALDLGV